jgi:Protein of unknown function (DUF3605)
MRVSLARTWLSLSPLGSPRLHRATTLAFMSSRPSSPSSVSSDEGKRIKLPELEYGYRTEPMDWAELRTFIVVENCLAKLSRSVEQQRDYEVYKRDLQRHWKSVYDHILCHKFNFERRVDAEDDRYYAHPPLSEVRETRKTVVRNDFPYYMTPGIEHWVLWKLTAKCTEAEIDEAKKEISQELGDVVDFMHWINPPHLKSLPDIDHVHILCLREGEK